VEHALGYELRPEALGLVATLWRAARAFVDDAERRESSAARPPLDLADAFRGLVLCAAIDRRGGLDAGLLLLDHASLLRSRNHHRVLRRELERVRALIAAVPGDVDPALGALVEDGRVAWRRRTAGPASSSEGRASLAWSAARRAISVTSSTRRSTAQSISC
jgi:hypothetical protein